MLHQQMKKKIYYQSFSIFLITYLILMLAFSGFLIQQERKTAGMELQSYGLRVNNKVENILEKHLDQERQIINIAELNNELLNNTLFFTQMESEMALFTGDYQLVFNTNDYWSCSYGLPAENKLFRNKYNYLDPRAWFTETEVKEMTDYLYANPQPKQKGDLSGYILSIKGFWLDEGMVIPEKITVNAMYANTFDQKGNLVSAGGTHTDEIIYYSNYQDSGQLAYFKFANIVKEHQQPPGEKRAALRQIVTDNSRLQDQKFNQIKQKSSKRINGLNYRYYLALPYKSATIVEADLSLTSDFWVTLASDVNIGERCLPTLIFIWVGCLAIFGLGAVILGRYSYKTYQQQIKLDQQRQEMINALAHDLKTPLSILSGYAENLEENIRMEKKEYYAQQIQNIVQSMDGIILQMLELTRLQSDFLEIKLEIWSLNETCKRVIESYKPLWQAKSISISVHGKALITADYALLRRVIENFLINAIEHTHQMGQIEIKLNEHRFEIHNSGNSIPKDIQETIWQPFVKGDKARNERRGTGLGLTIVKTILELHGFSHGLTDTKKGAIFWFEF